MSESDPNEKYGLANRKRLKFNEGMWAKYCESLEGCGQYIAAADSIGVSYPETFRARKENPDFAALCEEALERYRGQFVSEAQRRALEGYKEPIIGGQFRDEVVAEKTIYSDKLLELFLKRSKDGGFTDKQEVTMSGGFDIKQEMDLSSLSKKARKMLRELLNQINLDNANKALGKDVK